MSEKSNEFIDGYWPLLNAIRPLLTYCRNGIVRKSLEYGRIAMRILVAGGAGFKGRGLLEAEKLSFENGEKNANRVAQESGRLLIASNWQHSSYSGLRISLQMEKLQCLPDSG